jgi:hypothetical protein
MRWAILLGVTLAGLICAGGKEGAVLRVVVLMEDGTEGIPPGTKIRQIETVKETAGKQALREVKDRDRGEAVKRLDGTYVIKSAKVTLDSGKVINCKLLVSVEMGATTLKDVRFISTLEAISDRGKGTWQGSTAVGEQRD